MPLIIKKGQWWTVCCEEDLEQAMETIEILPSAMLPIGIWDLRKDAITALSKMEEPIPVSSEIVKLAQLESDKDSFRGF